MARLDLATNLSVIATLSDRENKEFECRRILPTTVGRRDRKVKDIYSSLTSSAGGVRGNKYEDQVYWIVEHGFGRLMQDFRAHQYVGKRIRFSAFVKTANAKDWAGLWMRADKGSKQLAFDNMSDRPITGTSTWRRYEIVLDVPENATGIFFGVLLTGSGTVWLNDAKFDVVGPTVLPTDGDVIQRPDEPTNLDFER